MASLDEIIETFNSVDDETRLSLLLDYAEKLPPLPPELEEERRRGGRVVPECQTPVHLWVLPSGDGVMLHAWVSEEAPTVQGVLSVLVEGCRGRPASEVASLPGDLISRLGLGGHLRMNRAVGIDAMLHRIRREASALAGDGASSGHANGAR